MDGKELKRRLRELLNEDSDSEWLDTRTTFDFLYEAATELVNKTHCLKDTQEITTVVDQTDYNLSADFLKLYLKNTSGNLVVKWGDDNFITWKDENDILYGNQTTSVSMPDSFAVSNADVPSQITGTATSNGTATGGLCALADTGADFTNVEAGASIHNTTDGSTGVVTSKTSSTILNTALFGGTNDDWSTSDAYVIQPQGRFKLILDPPPEGVETVTVYYIKKPAPVYSDYQVYGFVDQYATALIKYAFWLYKYRDKEANFGDAMYRYWDSAIRNAGYNTNQALNRKMKVSFKNGR